MGQVTRRFIAQLTVTAIILVTGAAATVVAQSNPSGAPVDPAAAQATATKTAADAKKEQEDKRATAALLQGRFRSSTLAGGTENEFRVPQPANRFTKVDVELKWDRNNKKGFLCSESPANPEGYPPATKMSDPKEPTATVFGIHIPSPPCLLPRTQYATITISASAEKDAKPQTVILLENSRLPVTVLWFPMTVTFIVLGLIYPGGAAASWYVSKRQYKKKAAAALAENRSIDEEEPKFLRSLDPVELTKNPWGRASIAKLQIFAFSFIIFGLLLFNVLRTGLLANMSTDILYLMGISAVGSAGAKIAHVAKRRLSMENWVWVRRKGWLLPHKDVQPHAKWSELVIDSGTKEFDPYRFQMAVFSLVVAIALINTSATGLEAFTVPPEMLGLLGISQVVFIGGQAMENGGFADLDKKLTEVRAIETRYQGLKPKADTARQVEQAKAAEGTQPAKTVAEENAEAEYAKFKTAVAEAKETFIAVYGDQIGELPRALATAETMEPELYADRLRS